MELSNIGILRYLRQQMIDIHCHILPDLDDGSDSLETSLKMAEMAIEDGITHVIGTPHANNDYSFVPKLIRSRRDELPFKLRQFRRASRGACAIHAESEKLFAR